MSSSSSTLVSSEPQGESLLERQPLLVLECILAHLRIYEMHMLAAASQTLVRRSENRCAPKNADF